MDKSKQGFIDPDIRNLVDLLNSKGYETTSSCSGRIVLLRVPEFGDKQHAEWLYKTHAKADFRKIMGILEGEKNRKLYFLLEPPIIHAKCKNLLDAEKLLNLAVQAGFKRSGVISIKKLTVEIKSSERLETPLKNNKEGFIQMLVEEANRKLERCKKKLEKLASLISSI